MKNVVTANVRNTIIGEAIQIDTYGYIWIYRSIGGTDGVYRYANGSDTYSLIRGLFLNIDNQWIHIVTVCDYTNKTLKVYRNGIQFGNTLTLAGTPLFPSTNRTKYVGAYSSTLERLTDGSLDEVRIYNRGLSADEVMGRYNKTKGRYE
jgi:hypothetical protein